MGASGGAAEGYWEVQERAIAPGLVQPLVDGFLIR